MPTRRTHWEALGARVALRAHARRAHWDLIHASAPRIRPTPAVSPVDFGDTLDANTHKTQVYELSGVGLDGKEKLFQKPWIMTTVMFVGALWDCKWLVSRAGGRRRAVDLRRRRRRRRPCRRKQHHQHYKQTHKQTNTNNT